MIQKLINSKNVPSKTGKIYLENLSSNKNYRYQDKFYIEFYPKFKKELYQNILKVAGTIKNLSKETNVKFTRLWDQLTRVPISIEVLNKVSTYLVEEGYNKYELKNIENQILYIKSAGSKSQKLYHPKFPINLKTKEGLRLISHLYHDGCISDSSNKQPLYVNQSKSEIKQFLLDAKKLFGNFERKIKYDFGNGIKKKKYFRINLPTVIGEIMIKAGFIPGDKTKKNPLVFDFIKNLNNKKLISEYLTKAFNDEGTVGKRELTLPQSTLIKEKMFPSNILLLNKLLFEKLGIKVNGPRIKEIYKNRYGNVATFVIAISDRKNLRMFNDKIKLIEHKRNKLEDYLIRARKTTTDANES